MTDEQILNYILETNREILRKLENAPTKDDLKEALQPIKDTIEKHAAFIEGNGTPGAKTRLAQAESEIAKLRADFEKKLEDLRCSIDEKLDGIPAKITMAVIKALGIPLLLALIIWGARVIYLASTK